MDRPLRVTRHVHVTNQAQSSMSITIHILAKMTAKDLRKFFSAYSTIGAV
jgi:hypothetical protein